MSKRSYNLRRLICHCLSIVLAFTLLGSNMLLVSSLTVGNRRYMQKYFSSADVTNELSKELDSRLEVIADKYGIDADILKSGFSHDYRVTVQNTAMNSLFNGRYTPVSSSSNVEMRCEKAVARFNEKQKTEKALSDEKTAELVVDVKEAFDSVYTVANAEEFSSVTGFFSASTKGAVMFSTVSLIIAVIVYLISGRYHGSLNYIGMALESAGGMSVALPALAFMKMKFSVLHLTNISAYNDAIGNAAGKTCFIIIAVGVVMLVAGAAIFISNYRYYSFKLKNSDAEYEIEKNLV
ncbi:MAG: hypothetical protein ACI4V4_00725 [Eubacterium sp.]